MIFPRAPSSVIAAQDNVLRLTDGALLLADFAAHLVSANVPQVTDYQGLLTNVQVGPVVPLSLPFGLAGT